MPRKREVTSVFDNDVCAPDVLELNHATAPPLRLRRWLEDVLLYESAMGSLDRAVLLKRIDDLVYLSSIEVDLHA